MMTRGFALISDNPAVAVWVMDPAVVSVERTVNMPMSALDRVRSVAGVRWAGPLALADTDARFPNGRFEPFQVIGVDDATLIGAPPLGTGNASVLRSPNAVVVDPGGTIGRLNTPARSSDQWPLGAPHLAVPLRPIGVGDGLQVNDTLLCVAGLSKALPRFPPRPLLYMTFSLANRVLPAERSRLTFVLVAAAPGVAARALAARIEAATGLRARSSEDFKADTVNWLLQTSEDVGDAATMLIIAMLVGFGVTSVMMFMFASDNMRYYAVFGAMGARWPLLLGMILVQAGVCALVGTGLGLGLCALAGRVFMMYGFPFRMLWFAPALGGLAVVLVSAAAAAAGAWPVIRMQPAALLTQR